MMVFDIISRFGKCGLEDVNQRAPLLTRTDNKYVLSTNQIQALLLETRKDFSVLTLNATNNFRYQNKYLDTPDGVCFLDHKQGRRRRMKMRFRHYVDSGKFFFELKLKGRRGITEKFRQPISAEDFEKQQLTNSLRAFSNSVLIERYGRFLTGLYVPALNVNYERLTLLSNSGSERITIDHSIHFQLGEFDYTTFDNFWVVEVKSRSGRTAVDKYLVRTGSRTVKSCSKYSVGFQISRRGGGSSRFTPTIRKFCRLEDVHDPQVVEIPYEDQKTCASLPAKTLVLT